MQKRVLAGLPILAGALIFLGLWIANKLTTPPWKSELNQYIAFKVSPADPPITIQRTIQAGQPWKFSTEMSAGSYSDCFYFSTTYCYNTNMFQSATPFPLPPDDVGGVLLIKSARGGETSWNEFLSTTPLLFPPDDLWCALVKTSARGEDLSWVVYIAKYQDLYNADWIVHESSKSIADPLLRVDLANIGCDRLVEPRR
jgi:hypothetical protein